MKCPKCGYELLPDAPSKEITKTILKQCMRMSGADYTEATQSLIIRFANTSTDRTPETLVKFLNRIKAAPYDIVHLSILDFFGAEYDKKGKGWTYLAGMIVNRTKERKSQKGWLNPIPR